MTSYVFFLYFILKLFKLIGLLLAVILSAAIRLLQVDTLASTTAIDIYKAKCKGKKSDKHYVNATNTLLCYGEL
jgi:Na+/proline symporter